MDKHLCPCCSQPLLRHISGHRIYWFCSECHQEMPIIKNFVKTALNKEHLVKNESAEEREQLAQKLRQGDTLYSSIKAAAFSDSLTQVANHHYFQVSLEKEWRRMAREELPLSLIVADLDFFKAYNDTYGTQAGDKCLQQIAKLIAATARRPADLVARYRDEEFVILLPNTKAEGAVLVAEKIRSGVKGLKIAQIGSHFSKYLTLSLGVACIVPSHEYSPAMLMTAAAQALTQAKAQGRDLVMLHEKLLREAKVIEQEKTLAF